MRWTRWACALLLCWGMQAWAAWPEKAVRIVVPYPPGGTTDILTRLLAQKLSDIWKQPVLVDNRPGGAAMIGSDLVAKSAPDGYTLLSTGAGPHAINISLFPKIPYDPLKDFSAISLLSVNPLLMVVPAQLPVNTVAEYIAWVKANPSQANYCSIGAGSPSHLAAELFKSMTGLSLTHVPYSGSGTAIIAAIGGVCSVLFDSVLSSGPQVRNGKLKALATGNRQRLSSWPQTPALDEMPGLQGYEAFTWGALLAPAGTPAEAITRINTDVTRILSLPDVRQRIEELGAIASPTSPQELDSFTRSEMRKWSKVIREGNIKPD
ncbi:MAG: tripartite tricarboxylate transporter substrate binding protein [Limnohabitans sp.]|jgi:tripartite-type tricarboxylate transporter receptor subunit TctC|nr:tripartite tricarboxylate transporter substrate binding protein [Limnohabitans sp.]